MSIKLNLGSHNKDIGDDWINIDGLDLPNVDGVCDLNNTPFSIFLKDDGFGHKNYNKFIDVLAKLTISKGETPRGDKIFITIKEQSVDELQMVEVLEHISFRKTHSVLKECYRILKEGGKFHVQVPDCGKAMEYYVNGEICECVPHKAKEYKSNSKCFICGGKGKIHPDRWLFSFLGAQKHKYDAHLNVFTKERLEKSLKDAGFKNLEWTDDVNKLKVNCYK